MTCGFANARPLFRFLESYRLVASHSKDTEALERALIATGKTTQAGRIQYVPEKIVEE